MHPVIASGSPSYAVRAVRCSHTAGDDQVYTALRRATDPLVRAWDRLGRARRVCIKFNQDYPPEDRVWSHGQLQQLVSARVIRATLRLLRERTDAELCCADTSFTQIHHGRDPLETSSALPLLREFGVEYINANDPPLVRVEVPGGGRMFTRYWLPRRAVEADAFVSVAKMKNHAFMGVTLCLKNLFGLMPAEPHHHSRQYFHHLVRMPYVLADLGRVFDPALNIVDALVTQAGGEWGERPGLVTDALIAGDQAAATDACATWLMGHNPQSDWLTPPFHRDRNALRVAAEAGFGAVDLARIDFESEVSRPLAAFYADETDPRDMVVSWRRTTAEQALCYRDNLERLVARYAGQYILLQAGHVRWHGPQSGLRRSRRELAGDRPEQALYLKYVDPDETDGEHFAVYEDALAGCARLEPSPSSRPVSGVPGSHG